MALPSSPDWVKIRSPRLLPVGLLALLGLVAALLYGHTLHAPWYFDDHSAILENPVVHDLGRALAGLGEPRGVSIFSFALNYWSCGDAVVCYHLTNILLHLLCALLVYQLLGRIFSGRLWPLLGALFFLAHPVQTQAVTYVVQRMTVLAALFFLLALELFLRARAAGSQGERSRSRWCYAGALLAGALAIGAKENAAVLPLALLLWVRCFDEDDRRWRPLLLAIAPFVLAPLAMAALRLWPLLFGTSLGALSGVGTAAGSPLHYLFTEFSVFWIYLRLLLLPYGQTLDYGYPLVTSLWTLPTLVALAALLGLGWGVWKVRARRPTLAFGLAWFFLTLAVESTLIPLDPLFEHRLYLPLFGVIVALFGLTQTLPRPRLVLAVLVVLLLICGALSWQRNALWNDQLAFSADNVRKAPQSERALFNLAARTLNSGRVEAGLALFRQSLERFPHSYRAYVELAAYERRRGRIDEALAILRQALDKVPEQALIYNGIGFLQALQGDEAGALATLDLAQQADPHYADSYFNAARIHAANHRLSQAEALYVQGLRESQRNPSAYADYAALLLRQGRRDEARAAARTALRIDPEQAGALRLLREVGEGSFYNQSSR